MEADFSGWVTKAGLRCADGRTIMPNAFQHQDKTQVPLVWQHGHNDPENVLGHVILENRDEGVYGYAFFNSTGKAAHAKELVVHKDINQMSIWANHLVEKAKNVMHGFIREVSLVIGGANPGALIDNIGIKHNDGEVEEIDEAIIYTGLNIALQHDDIGADNKNEKKEVVEHNEDDDTTLAEVLDSMNEDQKKLVHAAVAAALKSEGDVEHASEDLGQDATVQDVFDTMNEQQKQVLYYMIGEALNSSGDSVKQDDMGEELDKKEGTDVDLKHSNIFETNDGKDNKQSYTLSHDDIKAIVMDAADNTKSLKASVQQFALSHGINDIEVLFPEARALMDSPEFFSRRVEWVNQLLQAVRKSPFSRIKTVNADITVPEARAKGYIKGTLKKEEFFGVARRITTPTTIYKKQKLDRDDVVDITDFDVVVWMKGEMRIMLDEEIARAILVGDGRAVDDEDKVNESSIRPVATDHEVYTTTITVPLDAADTTTFGRIIDELALNRSSLRGSGQPTMYTTEYYLARLLLQKDTTGRKLYKNVDELATDMRVREIVPVEVMEEYPDIVAVIFNPIDYVVGADRGGAVAMFDDFDIDYNQYKYLIETRISGALVKMKSALVIRMVADATVLVEPAAPAFDGDAITIVNQTGVVYRNADTNAVMNAAGSPYAVAPGTTVNVHAEPAAGYYFETSNDDDWYFTAEEA